MLAAQSRLMILLALFVSLVPGARVRARLYGLFPHYHVATGARIGFLTVIAVSSAVIGRARIDAMNLFRGPFDLIIEDGGLVGSRNSVRCGQFAAATLGAEGGYARRFEIQRDARVTSGHQIDATGGFTLGRRSWLAGYGSQVWTHGAGARDRSVVIGDDCYIGSRVTLAPGSQVADRCIVSLGSLVVGRFDEPGCLIGSTPATVIKRDHDWHERLT